MRHLSRRLRLRPFQITLILTTLAVGLAFTISGTTEPIDSFAACAQAGYPITDSNPPLCQNGSANYLGTPVADAAPTTAPTTSSPFEILVDGDTHAPTPAYGQIQIDTEAEWQGYWARAHASLPALPPLIPVDFATSTVIAASLGVQSNTGYQLKITAISTSVAGDIVDITESTPTITCPVTERPTNRYLIVRTTKLTAPTSFRITKEMRHCP